MSNKPRKPFNFPKYLTQYEWGGRKESVLCRFMEGEGVQGEFMLNGAIFKLNLCEMGWIQGFFEGKDHKQGNRVFT